VIIEHRPGNAVGVAVLLLGLVLIVYIVLDAIARTAAPGTAAAAAILVSEVDGPMFLIVAVLLLLFPDGHLPSPRWRWLIAFDAALVVLVVAGAPFRPGPFAYYPSLQNPLGDPSSPLLAEWSLAYALEIAVVGLAALSLVGRWRRGGPVERAQIKWVAVAGAILAAAMVTYGFLAGPGEYSQTGDVLVLIGFATIPIAIVVAITRYHLYDIDRLISRSVSWAVITAVLVAVFVGGVIALQTVLTGFTQGQTLAVAGSTLVAFALFQPVRRRVQRAVDRRFDRSRFDGERMASAFADRLRAEVAIEAVSADLQVTIAAAIRPASQALWLRRAGR
jgi:hypothetical protein